MRLLNIKLIRFIFHDGNLKILNNTKLFENATTGIYYVNRMKVICEETFEFATQSKCTGTVRYSLSKLKSIHTKLLLLLIFYQMPCQSKAKGHLAFDLEMSLRTGTVCCSWVANLKV